jgi:glycosyltransferase involved in cell wall biosynthesis
MKILHVLPFLNSGGIERGVVDLCRAGQQHGAEVIATSGGGKMTTILEATNITHIPGKWYSKNPCSWPLAAKKLADIINAEGVDVVHAHSRVPCWIATLSKRHHRQPVVTTCHAAHNMGWFNLKKIYNQAICRGDQVIATSRFIEHYLKQYTIPIQKVHHIPRGVDSNAFVEHPALRVRQWRQEQQLDDRPIILFPARITAKKGQTLLIQALSYLPTTLSLQIVFIGKVHHSRSHTKILHQLASKAPAQHSIRFLGQTTDLSIAYQSARCVVNATLTSEAFGRIPLEAGAMSRLMIAPEHSGFLETIIPGQTGWHFKPGNALDLANCIRQCLSLSDEERQARQEQARQHVMENFLVEHMHEKTFEVYRTALIENQHSKKKPIKTNV